MHHMKYSADYIKPEDYFCLIPWHSVIGTVSVYKGQKYIHAWRQPQDTSYSMTTTTVPATPWWRPSATPWRHSTTATLWRQPQYQLLHENVIPATPWPPQYLQFLHDDIPATPWWHTSYSMTTYQLLNDDIPASPWRHTSYSMTTYQLLHDDIPATPWQPQIISSLKITFVWSHSVIGTVLLYKGQKYIHDDSHNIPATPWRQPQYQLLHDNIPATPWRHSTSYSMTTATVPATPWQHTATPWPPQYLQLLHDSHSTSYSNSVYLFTIWTLTSLSNPDTESSYI